MPTTKGGLMMELKTIIVIVLVAFIIGGFIFLQIRNKKKKYRKCGRGNLRPLSLNGRKITL